MTDEILARILSLLLKIRKTTKLKIGYRLFDSDLYDGYHLAVDILSGKNNILNMEAFDSKSVTVMLKRLEEIADSSCEFLYIVKHQDNIFNINKKFITSRDAYNFCNDLKVKYNMAYYGKRNTYSGRFASCFNRCS